MVLALNLQVNYFDPSGYSYVDGEGRGVLQAILSYLSAQPVGSVVFTQNVRPLQGDFYVGHPSQNFVGSPEVQMVPGVLGMVRRKLAVSHPDATFNSPLRGMLTGSSVEIVGAESCSDVLFTASSLRHWGYDVSVRESLVGSRDPYLHSSAITLLSSELGVNILS